MAPQSVDAELNKIGLRSKLWRKGRPVGKRYSVELQRLDQSYKWAIGVDIANFSTALGPYLSMPLIAVGSGGSLTTANFAAAIHQAPENAEAHAGLGFVRACQKAPAEAKGAAFQALLNAEGKRKYLVLRVAYGDLTLMIPVDSTDEVGLRQVVSKNEVKKVLAVLREDESVMAANTSTTANAVAVRAPSRSRRSSGAASAITNATFSPETASRCDRPLAR